VIVSEDNGIRKEMEIDLNNVEEKGIIPFNSLYRFFLSNKYSFIVEQMKDENNVSANEDKKSSKEKEPSDKVNSSEITEENNVENDKGNILY
jgi:hypothetical protein